MSVNYLGAFTVRKTFYQEFDVFTCRKNEAKKCLPLSIESVFTRT